jgi:hypothetical protein
MSQFISDGRPPQDAQFQNINVGSNLVVQKLTAGEVNSNILITGELVASSGLVTNLKVQNLTLAQPGSIIPNPGFIALPLSVATLSGSTITYVTLPAPRITFNTVITDTAQWSAFVPSSGTIQLKIYVPMTAALGTNVMSVSVNGTAYTLSSTLKTGTSFTYSTAAFDWTASAVMDVVISSTLGTGLIIGDVPYIGF